MSKKKKKKLARLIKAATRSDEIVATTPTGAAEPIASPRQLATLAGVLFVTTIWAYWPTFVWMEEQWRTEPDYSHGYLVFPLALVLLYFRSDKLPQIGSKIHYAGFGLMAAALAMRIVGRFAYMDFLDGWSLMPWVAGLVWIFTGTRAFIWASPAILFLLLLVPMPYRFESLLSFKLQGVATAVSSGLLRIFGIAAIPEGNTIWLNDRRLMVEEACSGLRIFMGMGALGFFFAALSDRLWIDRVVVMLAAFPLAIVVNIFRVAGTGLAYYWFSDAIAHTIHDFLGLMMIVLGASLLFATKSFWEHLYRPLPIAINKLSKPSLSASHQKRKPSPEGGAANTSASG